MEILEPEERPRPVRKLDLRYFTNPALCPLMVRQQARRAFELFLHLASRFLESGGREVTPSYEELCRACRLDPAHATSRTALSRLLRLLRETYGVIDFVPLRKRRPSIALRAPGAGDLLAPQRYVYFGGFGPPAQELFDGLESRAFAAKYLYVISQYEASLAAQKHRRAYWFYPLEKIAADYHISAQFAGKGLQALVEIGALAVNYGQRFADVTGGPFGKVNRYFHHGLDAALRREELLRRVKYAHPAEFAAARRLAAVLSNGATVKNVAGLCHLIACFSEAKVAAVIGQLDGYQRRNPRRRLGYVEAMLQERPPSPADRPPSPEHS